MAVMILNHYIIMPRHVATNGHSCRPLLPIQPIQHHSIRLAACDPGSPELSKSDLDMASIYLHLHLQYANRPVIKCAELT